MSNLIKICLFNFFFLNITFGQSELDKTSRIPNQQSSLDSVLFQIEKKHELIFSYSPETVPLIEMVTVPNKTMKIGDLIDYILNPFDIDYEFDGNNKLILFSRKKLVVQISGIIRDSESKESIPSATIEINHGEYQTYGNGEGFYSISIPVTDSLYFSVSALGYRPIIKKCTPEDLQEIFELQSIFLEDTVIISLPKIRISNYNPDENAFKFSASEIKNSAGTLGNSDVITSIKSHPSIGTGAEGQNGFLVRGGSPDHNLVLFDGMPIYEASHMGGLSSMFISESIKDVEFANSGFPARYGGRLSSVLNVRTKDGNQNQYYRNLNIGFEGISLHLNGPITKAKTSFSFSGRASWFGALTKPIIKRINSVEDYTLEYRDLHGKITHWFSPSNSISISGYKGYDLIRLGRITNEEVNGFTNTLKDFNRISWGNDLISVNWKTAIGNYIFMNARVGNYQYTNESTGRYDQLINDQGIENKESFGITSNSLVKNKLANIDFDIHTKSLGKLNIGTGIINHRSKPFSSENSSLTDTLSSEIDLKANELFFYLEDRFNIAKVFNIHAGVRYTIFNTDDVKYQDFQPRLSLSYVNKNHFIRLGYSRMTQYNHLLVNPGPGLPSDLWVLSTEKIKPQKMNEFSLSYSTQLSNGFSFGISSYYRRYYNQIDYLFTSNIFYALVNFDEVIVELPSNVDWEDSVDTGNGRAFGFEFDLEKSFEKSELSFAYTYGKSTRQFDGINNGETFPFKFDRTHDISSSYIYKLTDVSSINLSFTYGTGFPYSVVYDISPDGSGGFILNPGSRNNYRYNDFHHFDILYRTTKKLKEGQMDIGIGIYNVYNQLNPYYVYLYRENTESNESPVIGQKQVSIFPLLGHVNLTFIW